ncbi:MAG: DNA mismatch endonuclease Vsr [Clostridia bacterium]|nr:DNA mismatch endonuclease Vsr [Clostridia bacterium]
MPYNAIDLFSGCGGLTEGLKQAGFNVIAAVELDEFAARAYRANHESHGVHLFQKDIRTLNTEEIKRILDGRPLHLLAGCPPCQGFSSMRRRNKKKSVRDPRNNLILDYLRFVEELQPMVIMLENVPGLAKYSQFKKVYNHLLKLGYNPKYKVVNVTNYGVPQRRKRLVMVGSLLGDIDIPEGRTTFRTVRDVIGNLESVAETTDDVHRIFPIHTEKIQKRIEQTPADGGSRKDLPPEYTLECHKKEGVGFHDVYGRLRWDDVSSTITGGCLNPSKGRFLHPVENRCITAREAAMLQTFRRNYIFPTDIPRSAIALMIGNALPPAFCKYQSQKIHKHLDGYMADIFDEEKRSNIMSKVKNKNTEPELIIRKLLSEEGYKYRLNCKHIPCKPDIVFPGKKKAIFINGCFWHGHDCKRGTLPEKNREFWKKKINTNKQRDDNNYASLIRLGWDHIIIWQCEIKKLHMEELVSRLINFIDS